MVVSICFNLRFQEFQESIVPETDLPGKAGEVVPSPRFPAFESWQDSNAANI